MTNLALLLCIAGSPMTTETPSEGFGPRTTGRPIDGTVAARGTEGFADVWIQFDQKPSSPPTQPIPSSSPLEPNPPTPIGFKEVPTDDEQFFFVVVNRSRLSRPVTSFKDLSDIDPAWASRVQAYSKLTSLREIRYSAPVLGTAKGQRLQLLVFLSEKREENPKEFYWKLSVRANPKFEK